MPKEPAARRERSLELAQPGFYQRIRLQMARSFTFAGCFVHAASEHSKQHPDRQGMPNPLKRYVAKCFGAEHFLEMKSASKAKL